MLLPLAGALSDRIGRRPNFLIAALCGAALTELFSTHVRASGFAVPYSLAVALTGGTAPYLQAWLSSHGRGDVFLGYTVVLMLVMAAVAWFMPETKGSRLE
ncbi:MAG: MFS transporter [Actinophytocola sp.]|nr:MFS transporter [Actinophytocola sp.]